MKKFLSVFYYKLVPLFLKKIICTGLKKMELIHQNPGQNKQKKRSNGSINIIEQKKNLISFCKKTYIFQPKQMVY